MESNNLQDSKSSSEEDQADQHHRAEANDEAGTGRSYECVFCKRGFTTAQALGGHMNIHRKERAKTRPISSPLAKGDDHDHHPSMRPSYHHHLHHHVNYRTYMPVGHTSSWVVRAPPHANLISDEDLCANINNIPKHQNLLRDDHQDWRSGSGLSLGIGRQPSDHDHDHVDIDDEKAGGHDGLDLELRLGHDP